MGMTPDMKAADKSPLRFFVLVLAISLPFWLIGGLSGIDLLPGLPIAALMACCPVIAAAILTQRADGSAGVRALLRRSFDFRRVKSKIWYAPTLLLMPLVSALSFVMLRLGGTPVPDPQIALLPTAALCVVFFVGALGEELGWSGYAIEPMQARWGALKASLLLGAIWAVWHYPALAQTQRSLEWIAWWTVGTVAARVIMVWLYNHAGRSVFVTALFHMMVNVTWQLFPVNGSFFDPRVSGLITALIAVMIVIVWENAATAQKRPAR